MELALCGEFGDPQLALNPKDPHPIIKLEMMLWIILGLLQMCDLLCNVTKDPKKGKTLIVIVYLLPEKISNQQNMAHSQLDHQIKDASISVVLEFKFELFQGDTIKKMTIETCTHCNLGDSAPESRDGGYLGYYQDDITISLSCIGERSDGSAVAWLRSPLAFPNSKAKKWSEFDTW